MNKARSILGVAALVLPLTGGMAFAQNGTATQAEPSNGSAVVMCDGGRCDGTEGRDTIVGTNRPERIFALGGDDDIELDAAFPSGSSDEGYGGEGRDCIDGGGGNDLMIGGPGDDNRPCEFTAFVDPQAALTGGPGNDTIYGGPGDDSMNGIFDDDLLLGGTGNDLLRDTSPRDSDRLHGGPDRDTLNARDGDGNDLIDGGHGDDECTGDPDDEFVNCERVSTSA
jgi:Ca2+-binding RTX toxin-like protein